MLLLPQARAHIGDRVRYRPPGDVAGRRLEYGVITSVNDRYVFVRFGDDHGSMGCTPEDLDLLYAPRP